MILSRQNMKQKRLNLSPYLYREASDSICNKIKNEPHYCSSKVIYCYCSVNNEVDLTSLINYSLKIGKIIALPKVFGDTMQFYVIKSLDDVNIGCFNVLEPTTNILAPEPDLVIVPGLFFTLSGKRMGYGKGYYDRYLSIHKAYTIGASFDFQIQTDFEVKSHDIILDKIITN